MTGTGRVLHISLKRAYDDPSPSDGWRVLVDRLWPRGVKKADLALDDWLKDLAPSSDLRRWYNHESDKWQEFQKRYKLELDQNTDAVKECLKLCRKGPVTLVYAAKSTDKNNAVVLKDYLQSEKWCDFGLDE